MFISIIIPALNEEQNIGRCLESILEMKLPINSYEVILMDNGSKDKTISIANSYKNKISMQIHTMLGVNISELRNYGVQYSIGEILAFLDADCTVPQDWIKKALEIFKDYSVGAVGCSCKVPEDTSWVAKTWDLNNMKKRVLGEVKTLPTGGLIVSKKCFLAINGFNEALITNEDFDFCYRLGAKGIKLYSSPELSVIHWGVPDNLKEFFIREKWHGTHVLRVFLSDIWELKNAKAVAYGIFYCISILGLVLSILKVFIQKNFFFFIFFVIIMILVPIMISIRVIVCQNVSYRNFLKLAVIFLYYGVARASSILFLKKTN